MNNVLAFDLTRMLYKPGTNLVLSPFSLHCALCLVLPGADGISRAELMQMLFNIKTSSSKSSTTSTTSATKSKDLTKKFAQDLRKFFRDNDKVLKNANFLYANKRFSVKPEFVQTVTKQFMAVAKKLNFADTVTSLKVINNDVKKATKGMIPHFIDSIKPETELILVNAIYFKGLWKYPFSKDSTLDEEFHLGNGKKIKTKMMFIRESFPQYHCPNLKVHALKLEYNSGTVSMVILLPDPKSSVQNLLAKLNKKSLKPVLDKLKNSEVELTLPRFKMASTHELSEYLQTLGLVSVFDERRACFPGISKGLLFISEVIQKAAIEVNEKGTKAAAATAESMSGSPNLPEPIVFRANRPFVFLLICKYNQNVLFTGVVENPIKNK